MEMAHLHARQTQFFSISNLPSEWHLPCHLIFSNFRANIIHSGDIVKNPSFYDEGFDTERGAKYERASLSEYKVLLPKSKHSPKLVKIMLENQSAYKLDKQMKRNEDLGDLSIWENDDISPSAEIDSYLGSNAVLVWREEATY